MLQIITSLPGEGKTTYIYERMREIAEKFVISENTCDINNKRVMIIVPEQFHFETEHSLYKKLGARLISKFEITSFTKLSADINNKYGNLKPYADEVVREINMLKTLSGLEKKLEYYNVGKKGFSELSAKMLSLIEIFQKEGISPVQINSFLKENPDINHRLHLKLSDLSKIYSDYDYTLGEEFADRLDDTKRASEYVYKHEIFKNREVFLDGFDGFSGSQFQLIKAVMSQANVIAMTLLTDKLASDNASYIAANSLADKLFACADELKIPSEVISISDNPLFKARNPVSTELVTAPDTYAECRYIAAKIRNLIGEEYNFNDIAVLTRNKNVLPALASAMSEYKISAFIDIPEPVIEKPLVRFLILALEAVSFKPEKLMLYIKSGFVRIKGVSEGLLRLKSLNALENIKYRKHENVSDNNIVAGTVKSVRLSRYNMSRLEEAQIRWRLTASEWKNPFPEQSRFFKVLEPVRSEIIDPLLKFKKAITNTTGDKITEALSDFLINKLEIQRTVSSIVNKRSGAFKKGFQIDRSMNDEYRQLWETIINVLESMHVALYDYPINVQDYIVILTSILSKTQIAKPPQVIDAVTVGDLERSRTEGIKIAFIMGVNQGVFPKSLKTEGEFNADEIDELLRIGVSISENRAERYYREQFVINKAMTLPTEKLYLTSPQSDLAWNSLSPSPLFERLKVSNPHFYTNEMPVSFTASTSRAVNVILSQVMDKPELYNMLKDFTGKDDNSKVMKERIEKAYQKRFSKNHLHTIDKDSATILMKTESFSPSRIELLNSCSFKYFCEKGLNLNIPGTENDSELNSLQRGNLIHYCLYKILSDYADNFNEFTSLKPAVIKGLAESYTEKFREEQLLSGYGRSVRQDAILYSYTVRIAELMNILQYELGTSDFKPAGFEESFSYDMAGIKISGKIDRYDLLSDKTGTYVKVVDYKTGRNIFNFPAVYYGLGLQALLYLFGILEKHSGWKASGAYYYAENTGYVSDVKAPDGERILTSKEQKNAHWLKSHIPDGIQIKSSDITPDIIDLEKLDKKYKEYAGFSEKDKSLIKQNIISTENLEELKIHIQKHLQEKLSDILSGSVNAYPIKNGIKLPCDFCDFIGFCGKDEEMTINQQTFSGEK